MTIVVKLELLLTRRVIVLEFTVVVVVRVVHVRVVGHGSSGAGVGLATALSSSMCTIRIGWVSQARLTKTLKSRPSGQLRVSS